MISHPSGGTKTKLGASNAYKKQAKGDGAEARKMDIASRLERVEQEIGSVENEKLQWEHLLGDFWEHMPAVDPSLIRERMLFIQNQIRSLENRKRALLQEQQSLIVQAVTLGGHI